MGDFVRDFDRRRSGGGRSDRNRSGSFGRRDRDEGRGSDRGRDRDRGGGRDRGRDRRSERHEMHSAICDKCGKDCEVPFKPTQGKPIYCDDCFKDKSREVGSRSEFGKPINNENNDQINKKLDKILKILEEHVKEEIKPKEEIKEGKKSKKIKLSEEEQPDLEEPKSIEKKKPKKKKAKKKKS